MAETGRKSYAGSYDKVRTSPTNQHWNELCDYLDVGSKWREVLIGIFTAVNFEETLRQLAYKDTQLSTNISPTIDKLFSWTRVTGCEPNEVKVVMIGERPVAYPNATGIAFTSTRPKFYPSIKHLREAAGDGQDDSDLNPLNRRPFKWSTQGVLMINDISTTAWGGYHSDVGWQKFTKALVEQLIKRKVGVVFILFGVKAEKTFKQLGVPPVENPEQVQSDVYAGGAKPHRIWKYPHPSHHNITEWNNKGLNPFGRANEHLKKIGKCQINWTAGLNAQDKREWKKVLGL